MKPRTRRHVSPGAALALLGGFVVPWFVGVAWLLARVITWVSPHVVRGDGLVLVIAGVAAGFVVLVTYVSRPLAHTTDTRDTEQALAVRNALRPSTSRRPACPPQQYRPRETR